MDTKGSKRTIIKRSTLVEGNNLSSANWVNKHNLLIAHGFYIVSITKILHPRYFEKPFDSKHAAHQAIKVYLKDNTRDFVVESGKVIAEFGIKSTRIIPGQKRAISFAYINVKYEYPSFRVRDQQRKDFRTMKRRAMRRWNAKLGI